MVVGGAPLSVNRQWAVARVQGRGEGTGTYMLPSTQGWKQASINASYPVGEKKREKRVISSDCEAGPELQVPRR
jgi:hypothetical protein